MDHLVVMQRALVARHLHLLDEVAVPLLHVLPQSALVAVRRAAPVLAHVRPALFVHRLDVDFQLPPVGKSLRHEIEIFAKSTIFDHFLSPNRN